MRKVKIAVLKCAFHQDLADRYASPALAPVGTTGRKLYLLKDTFPLRFPCRL